MDIELILEESPVGEHQSNGEVENAVGRIQGQIRRSGTVWKFDWEKLYLEITPSWLGW